MARLAWWQKLDLVVPVVYILIDEEAERTGQEAGLDYNLHRASPVPESWVSEASPLPKTEPPGWESNVQCMHLGGDVQ